jgi:hypothetical protein
MKLDGRKRKDDLENMDLPLRNQPLPPRQLMSRKGEMLLSQLSLQESHLLRRLTRSKKLPLRQLLLRQLLLSQLLLSQLLLSQLLLSQLLLSQLLIVL